MPTLLPDLTITIPGALRQHLARAVMKQRSSSLMPDAPVSAANLRLAADLVDPDATGRDVTRPAQLTADQLALTAEQQAVVDQDPDARVTFTDGQGDSVFIESTYADRADRGELFIGSPESPAWVTLDQQARMAAVLTANLQKHGVVR